MPFKFTVHPELRLVYKSVWGRYTDGESDAAIAEWDRLNDSGRSIVADYAELHDLIDVTDYCVTIEKIKQRAGTTTLLRARESRPPKQVAYVVRTNLAYGTGRIYETLLAASGEDFRVFRSLTEAHDWLGLSREQIARLTRYCDTTP